MKQRFDRKVSRKSSRGLRERRRVVVAACAVFMMAALVGCVEPGAESTQVLASPVSVLSGLVIESGGNPVEGAAVEIMTTPPRTVYTDASGHFSIEAAVGLNKVVVTHGLHLSHHAQVEVDAGGLSLEVLMLPVERAGFFEASKSATLRHKGASLSIPADAFVFADDDSPVRGTIYWRMTIISLMTEAQMQGVPALGDIRAESILNATFFSEGRAIDLSPSTRAELLLPVSNDYDLLAEGPLSAFYFDESRFDWAQGAPGELMTVGSDLVWRTKINRFTWWACAAR